MNKFSMQKNGKQYIDTLPSRRWNAPLLKYGLHIVPSSQGYNMQRGKKKTNFKAERPDKNNLSQMIQVNINNKSC